ncbi:MAG TPA: glycosyltransferase [Rubrivivax sp.]|nr:glycosyltransferase [Rubrivivax sp.]
MIFVTVGSDLPFDRLVRVVDEWAHSTGRTDVFAQIGDTKWRPAHIEWSQFLQPPDFARRVAAAKVVVAHAGMGSVLSALQWEKPILVMPRRASLGEVRNEHQLATATHLASLGTINVAMDEVELRDKLRRLRELQPSDRIGPYASAPLINALREVIARAQR